MLLSLTGNAVFRGVEIETPELLTLVQYAYWIIAFYTTVVIVSTSPSLFRMLAITFAYAILLVACLRLYEAIFFGRWGAWTGSSFMSQNGYGFQFSTFTPFIFILPFIWRGTRQKFAILSVILMIFAIAGNGSRSSWIAVITSIALFLFLLATTSRKGILYTSRRVIMLVGIGVLIIASAPPNLLEPIISRFNTLETLDSDKSYAIRQLMVQKGQRLFEDNPLFGVGIGRFRQASIPLDVPEILSYAEQDYFDIKSSHNSYISMLGETGLVGVLPFGILHIVLVFSGMTAAIRLAQRGQLWGIAVFCSYVGMSIHLWALSGLTGTGPWVIYGLVAGMIEYERYNKGDQELASNL